MEINKKYKTLLSNKLFNLLPKEIHIEIVTYLDIEQNQMRMRTVCRYFNRLLEENEPHRQYRKLCLAKEDDVMKTDYWNYGNKKIHRQFKKACSLGYLELIKYMYRKYKINIHMNKEGPFYCACVNNQLDVAQYLWELGKRVNGIKKEKSNNNCVSSRFHPINLDTRGCLIYKDPCEYGQTKTTEWIFQIAEKEALEQWIDIIFRDVCYRGDIKLAKWFIGLCKKHDLKISHINYNVLTHLYQKKNLEMIRWLYTEITIQFNLSPMNSLLNVEMRKVLF